MIVANRVYAVLSVLVLVLITIFYLIHLNSGHNREYILYIQNNSSYALQNSPSYRDLNVLNASTGVYSITIGKVFLNAYDGNTTAGRFVLVFSQPGQIEFTATTDSGKNVGNVDGQNILPYYPLYVDFNAPSGTTYINLQYKTSLQSIVLYKLSVEFY